MIWANFLHLYQPAEQQPDILDAVITQSYRPLLAHFIRQRRARLTLNVNGALLELLDRYGHRDVLDHLRSLAVSGRVEFTGSAKYHALLPLLEEREAARQITINTETLRYYLGSAFRPVGFFPPEMACNDALAALVAAQGFQWIVVDEIALCGDVERVHPARLYRHVPSGLLIFFRERRVSNLIMSAVVRTPKSLLASLAGDLRQDRALITAMDGETFGHHRPGLEKLLFGLLAARTYTLANISDLVGQFPEVRFRRLVPSTWASSPQDIAEHTQFLSWSDPQNPIHRAQWQFVRLVVRAVHHMRPHGTRFSAVRKKLDLALASDHFWWASAKPWWSLEMIEDGAYRLLATLRSIPSVPQRTLDRASRLYETIVSTAFRWQRSGRIRRMMQEQNTLLRIPFKDRTVGRGGAELGVYHAFLSMLQRLERRAREQQEYEKAILWRDAAYKLRHRHDIYDAISAIDLIRLEIPHEKVERTIARFKARYRRVRGGQPEQRGR